MHRCQSARAPRLHPEDIGWEQILAGAHHDCWCWELCVGSGPVTNAKCCVPGLTPPSMRPAKNDDILVACQLKGVTERPTGLRLHDPPELCPPLTSSTNRTICPSFHRMKAMFMPRAVVPIDLAPGGVVRLPQPATEIIKATRILFRSSLRPFCIRFNGAVARHAATPNARRVADT